MTRNYPKFLTAPTVHDVLDEAVVLGLGLDNGQPGGGADAPAVEPLVAGLPRVHKPVRVGLDGEGQLVT